MKQPIYQLCLFAIFLSIKLGLSVKRDLGMYEYRGLEKLGVVNMLSNLVKGVQKTFLPKKQHRIGKTAGRFYNKYPAEKVLPSRTVFLVEPQGQRINLQ